MYAIITNNILAAKAPKVSAQLNKYIIGKYSIMINDIGINKISDRDLIFSKTCFVEAKIDINNAGITVK